MEEAEAKVLLDSDYDDVVNFLFIPLSSLAPKDLLLS
jgi:hypothetical protein